MLCQFSKVSGSLLPVTGKMTDGEDGDNRPIVEYPAIFSIIPGLLEDFLGLLPARADLVIVLSSIDYPVAVWYFISILRYN